MGDNRCQGSDGHQNSHPVQVVLVVDHGQNLHATNITVLHCKYTRRQQSCSLLTFSPTQSLCLKTGAAYPHTDTQALLAG